VVADAGPFIMFVGRQPEGLSMRQPAISKWKTEFPNSLKHEPLPPHNQVFDVPDSALDSVYGEL